MSDYSILYVLVAVFYMPIILFCWCKLRNIKISPRNSTGISYIIPVNPPDNIFIDISLMSINQENPIDNTQEEQRQEGHQQEEQRERYNLPGYPNSDRNLPDYPNSDRNVPDYWGNRKNLRT